MCTGLAKSYGDGFEALVAAIYLDFGYSTSYAFCVRLFKATFSEEVCMP